METIVTQRHRNPSRDELKLFLGACRDEAIEDDHFKIASISLDTRRLDPLAVLESIYERDEYHFYIEHPSKDVALAGAEAVVLGKFHGSGRFQSAQEWVDEILENTIAVGDFGGEFSGPHFYAGFTFESKLPDSEPFAPATLFLPRWQVARRGMSTTAVANFKVDPDADLDALTDKLWAAYQKFSGFSYGDVPSEPSKKLLKQTEFGTEDQSYVARVSTALRRIEEGRYRKIVLSRAVDQEFDHAFNPLTTLNGLRSEFRDCYSFSFENDRGQSFIGSTPELLARVKDRRIETMALAGTSPRGKSAREDAQFATELIESEKEAREHAHVVESIRRRLGSIGVEIEAVDQPELVVLPNVQHLRTRIRAELAPDSHLLDIVSALHPTPAVGGVPRETALPDIDELEPHRRGLYAGVLGYFNHRGEGEFCVGLRAGLIDGKHVRLFAGAGIVSGSDPEKEYTETELKISALRDALVHIHED